MTFQELNLSKPVLRAVARAGYEKPSPIQAGAIPPVLQGHDLLGCAQTGTGKTAAFALPMLDLLSARPPKQPGAIRALILTPTRELALQIDESFAQYGQFLKLRHAVIFGGVGQGPQVERLKQGVDILVACPGRLNDLIGQGYVDLGGVEIFVLDEADRMLDMGFVHDVKRVIAKLPLRRQTLMFSATMPAEIEQLAAGILREPAFVKVDPVSSTVDRIQQSLYFVSKADKRKLLPWLIQNLQPPVHNALVFSRTKHGADRIAKDLVKQGIPAAAIHGNKSQNARVAALEGFKAGRTKVLVATDIAARGIDISELSHVFNYDLPEVPETYVHRIGRTARAGADGVAVSFCAPEEREYLAGIEKLNRKKIPVVSGHPWDDAGAAPAPAAAKAAQPARPVKVRPLQPGTPVPPDDKKEENIMDESKKSAPRPGEGGDKRSRSRRGRRDGKPRPAQGGQPQAKFDPHFLTGAETAVLPAKTVAPAPDKQPAAQPGRPARGQQGQRPARDSRPQPPAEGKKAGRGPGKNQPKAAADAPRADKPARGQKAAPAPKNAPAERGRSQAGRAPAKSPAPGQGRAQNRAGRAGRSDDPGLVLISRRPPQQKFSSFEEYMAAHGGATAPIEDHSEDYE